jgi:hypothetical protein
MRLKTCGIYLDVVMDVVSAHLGVYTADQTGPSHRQQMSQAKVRKSLDIAEQI